MNMRNQLLVVDAQVAMGFVEEQAAYVEQQVNEAVYPEIIYPQIIPVDTGANPFTQTVTYYSSDKYGQAKWINGNSDDIPLAGTERAQHKTAVHTAGIGYGWGWEELNTAILMNVNLQAEDALAARRAYEEMVQRVLLNGDASKGFNGLLNYPGIGSAAALGVWNDATPTAQILADVNNLLMGTRSAANGTAMANTLLLPTTRLAILATRMLDGVPQTLLQWLRANNAYTALTGQPLEIRGLDQLETAGAGGTARAIAYNRNPQSLKAHIPMPHRFLGAFQDGPLNWVVPGVFRLGGLDIRRPAEVRYLDGI